MAGIYLHIPFCTQKCHYCNFFSLASKKNTAAFVSAICNEIVLQNDYLQNEIISTIYFGGGTPSLLNNSDLKNIFENVFSTFKIEENAEITLEANPDDLKIDKIRELSDSPINRLSIGIQSFFDDDLQFLNRSHSSDQASEAIFNAHKQGLSNISIDLIYGIPTLTDKKWKENIKIAIDSGVQHISAYSLTVEANTAFDLFIKKGRIKAPEEEQAARQFEILMDTMNNQGFIHYEISNFCKEGFFSRHNSNYWKQQKYLGLGPSAHSFDLDSRQWNVANLQQYTQSINAGNIPFEKEILTASQKYNEYIMTGLRTIWGVNLKEVKLKFGEEFLSYLNKNSQKYIADKTMELKENALILTEKGKFLADGIASDLFID
jgi:oxygen-independent coproporphyrinogen-3 oxidase